MTGFFLDIPEMSGKQLGLLREVLPHLSRLAVIGVSGLNAVQFAATEAAAKAVGLEAEIVEVRSADDSACGRGTFGASYLACDIHQVDRDARSKFGLVRASAFLRFSSMSERWIASAAPPAPRRSPVPRVAE